MYVYVNVSMYIYGFAQRLYVYVCVAFASQHFRILRSHQQIIALLWRPTNAIAVARESLLSAPAVTGVAVCMYETTSSGRKYNRDANGTGLA